MVRGFAHGVIRPVAIFVGVTVVVVGIILAIGNALLGLHPHEIIPGNFRSEWVRQDLIAAVVAALAVLLVCSWLAKPKAGPDVLDKDLVLGHTDFWDTSSLGPMRAKDFSGPMGTAKDIAPGYKVFAQAGQLGTVLGMLPGEEEFGKRRRGLIYVKGAYGANEEMWIPVEAVMGVWPETQSVLLAAKGDEMEHFGWTLPPESFRRGQELHEAPKSF